MIHNGAYREKIARIAMKFSLCSNFQQFVGVWGVLAVTFAANSDEAAPAAGLIPALTGRNASNWAEIQRYGVNLGGWATAGFNYNASNPNDRNNGPVSMTDRTGEFNLYQLNLFLEKALVKSTDWDVGGRFDFMFGTDSRYTQASGHWDTSLISQRNLRYYDIALPQAYVEVFSPIGNGLNGKFGHFYSIIGYESVSSPPNFFSSHSYSFKSSPFTTTGALFSYALSEQWSINLGVTTGADNFDRDLGAWSQMSGLTWTNADTGTTVSFSVLQGDVFKNRSSELMYYSAILQQNLGKWRYVLQHDLGTQDHAVMGKNAEWYSVVQYLTYDLDNKLSVGLRWEWFRDQDGFRYSAGEAGYYETTAGLNWKPCRWLTVRPEIRYDWADSTSPAFNMGTKNSQFLAGTDFIIQF